MTVAVAIPVLGRPQRIQPLLDSLHASEGQSGLHAYFVASPSDLDEIAEIASHVGRRESTIDPGDNVTLIIARWEPGPGDFARKTNAAFRTSSEPWFFAGADDLHFHPGWADEAISVAEESGAGMVGTNDLGNARVVEGRHATHSLFRRSYVEECGTADHPGEVYCEEYDHQFCDTEAYETAVARDCFAFAPNAVVEHLHPFWAKGEMDETYKKGLAHADADRRLFQSRRILWG